MARHRKSKAEREEDAVDIAAARLAQKEEGSVPLDDLLKDLKKEVQSSRLFAIRDSAGRDFVSSTGTCVEGLQDAQIFLTMAGARAACTEEDDEVVDVIALLRKGAK